MDENRVSGEEFIKRVNATIDYNRDLLEAIRGNIKFLESYMEYLLKFNNNLIDFIEHYQNIVKLKLEEIKDVDSISE
jgi:hypothetical protein